jgi:hypothetical protein
VTDTEPPNLLQATQLVTAAAQAALTRTIREHMPEPVEGSTAAIDFQFPDDTWIAAGGRAPLAVTTLLLSGAGEVLTDLGDLVGAARGPVTAPTLVRYVVEHIAEIYWLLSPGTYTVEDDVDPMDGMSSEQRRDLFMRAQITRIRRAAVRSYGWTIEFERGRIKPLPGEPRLASMPVNAPEDLEAILEPHGLRTVQGSKRPSDMTNPAKKARAMWKLDPGHLRPPLAPGPLVEDVSATKKVNALAERYLAEGGPQHAEVYSFLSTSIHPNPFAISEVGGSGRFERPASEMSRLTTIALGAFALGLELVNGYAGWPLDDAAELHRLIAWLRDCSDAWDDRYLGDDGG